MMVNDATRIRLIRAYLGMDSKSFAARLGVGPDTVSNWEHGRSSPTRRIREELMRVCQLNGLGFLPSGYPVPQSEFRMIQTEEGE